MKREFRNWRKIIASGVREGFEEAVVDLPAPDKHPQEHFNALVSLALMAKALELEKDMSFAKRQLEDRMAEEDNEGVILTELYGSCVRCGDDVEEDFENLAEDNKVDFGKMTLEEVGEFKKKDVAGFLDGSYMCSYCNHVMNKDD